MEQGDHSKRSNRENRTTFSDVPYISGVFQLDEPKKRFQYSNRNFQTDFLANGKQPLWFSLPIRALAFSLWIFSLSYATVPVVCGCILYVLIWRFQFRFKMLRR